MATIKQLIKPNVWLSGKDLCEQNKKIEEYEIVARGSKLNPEDELLEKDKNEGNLNNLYELLKLERVLTGRSKGIYEKESFRVKVTRMVGKWVGFGYIEKGQLYLQPHEALLLVEMNRLEVTFDDVPISLEQAYAVFLGNSNNNLNWEEYTIYTYLFRAGYFLFFPDIEADRIKYEASQDNQTKKEDDMIWCVLNEKLNLPFSFDFVKSNYEIYLQTKASMQKNFCAIGGHDETTNRDSDDDDEPPTKKFKPFNEEQERNFLDILKAEAEYLTYEEIFRKFSFIARNEFTDSKDKEAPLKFSFDICYQKTNFKRKEQLANYRLLVLSPKDKFPSNSQLEVLRQSQPYQVPIVVAIVSQSIQFSICTF